MCVCKYYPLIFQMHCENDIINIYEAIRIFSESEYHDSEMLYWKAPQK